MTHKFQSIPSPSELKQKFPSLPHHQNFIEQSRQGIKNVLDAQDPRFLLIVGPCSVHNTTAALEFARKLRLLAEDMKDVFVVAMRVYYEKPRTCLGWKGLATDPYLDGSHDIEAGLSLTRKLLLDLCDLAIPVASEILEPATIPYFEDLLSWGCIGARTSESQVHRQLASGLSFPIAFKNNPDGNINIAVRGVVSATAPHSYVGVGNEGKICRVDTTGNRWAHIVLRGGENRPNYSDQSVAKALNILEIEELPRRLIIDCSHDNSFKDHIRQPVVFQDIIRQVCKGNTQIRGLILESNLEAGKQSQVNDLEKIIPTRSITDSCMGWDTTEKLIRSAYDQIKQSGITPTSQTAALAEKESTLELTGAQL